MIRTLFVCKLFIVILCIGTLITLKKVFFMSNTTTLPESSALLNRQNVDNEKRLLPLEGAFNVRDLGGYITSDGKTVKWNRLIRAGDLHKLTDADLDYLNGIPVRTYIDFRDREEAAAAPDKKPASVTNLFHIPIDAGDMMQLQRFTIDDGRKLMEEVNRMLVRYSQQEYKEFFRIASDESKSPLLFHCSAGKDRTGFVAALFLSALGVDYETIVEDYMLSATYLKEKYAEDVKAIPQLEPLMTVKRSYLEAAFEVINNEYGGVENYLTQHLNVDLETLKKIYTE